MLRSMLRRMLQISGLDAYRGAGARHSWHQVLASTGAKTALLKRQPSLLYPLWAHYGAEVPRRLRRIEGVSQRFLASY